MTIDEALGEVIREARGERTQKEFGELLGWAQTKVSLVEAGKQPVNFKEMDRIAEVLGKDALQMIQDAYRKRGPRSISG